MPYLQIHLYPDLDPARQAELAAGATRLLAEILHKRPEVTVVRIAAGPEAQWFAAGAPVPGRAAFAEVRISQGSNSTVEKACFLAELQRLIEAATGPMSAPTYIVIHEIARSDWGYDGLSQAERGGRP